MLSKLLQNAAKFRRSNPGTKTKRLAVLLFLFPILLSAASVLASHKQWKLTAFVMAAMNAVMFNRWAGGNKNLLVYWLPTRMHLWEGMESVTNGGGGDALWQATKINWTKIAHHTQTVLSLALIHTECDQRLRTKPTEGLILPQKWSTVTKGIFILSAWLKCSMNPPAPLNCTLQN